VFLYVFRYSKNNRIKRKTKKDSKTNASLCSEPVSESLNLNLKKQRYQNFVIVNPSLLAYKGQALRVLKKISTN
tara:strand:+ start:37183 stop:37404 length:222 start_codon:yes stop_codon:yes gene_type:complete